MKSTQYLGCIQLNMATKHIQSLDLIWVGQFCHFS